MARTQAQPKKRTIKADSRGASLQRPRVQVESRLQARDLISITLTVFTALCLYTLMHSNDLAYLLANPSWNNLSQPTFVALLVSVFAIPFLYKSVRRHAISLVPNVMATVISFLFVVALVWVSVASGSEALYLKLGVALFNPFVGPVLALSSIAGLIALIWSRAASSKR